MTQSATTPAADDALRAVPAEVAGATRAMFFTSTSALPMMRGPMVAYAPEDDGGSAPADAGGGSEPAEDQGDDDTDPTGDADEGDDEGSEGGEDDDQEEIEYEGKAYKLPKELKGALLRHSDYTQKTQALSEARKAFETEQASHVEMTKALRSQIGTVTALENRVEQFKNLDWEALKAADIDRYRELRDSYMETRDQLESARGDLDKAENEHREKERQADATRLRETEAALADPKTGIPGWGPKVFQELVSFAGTQGISATDLRQASAGEWKILHLASLGAKAQQQQQRVQRHKQVQQTQPAAETKGRAPSQGLSGVKDTGEWMRRRNAQVAKRGQ